MSSSSPPISSSSSSYSDQSSMGVQLCLWQIFQSKAWHAHLACPGTIIHYPANWAPPELISPSLQPPAESVRTQSEAETRQPEFEPVNQKLIRRMQFWHRDIPRLWDPCLYLCLHCRWIEWWLGSIGLRHVMKWRSSPSMTLRRLGFQDSRIESCPECRRLRCFLLQRIVS